MRRRQPEEVIRQLEGLRVSSEGWRRGRVVLGSAIFDSTPYQGLLSPDGRAWEALHGWTLPLAQKALRAISDLGLYIDQRRLGGVDLAVVEIEGEHLLAEHTPAVYRWSGLDSVSEWTDQSCGGCPWQHHATARWTHGEIQETVTLYVRWRSWGIRSESCLWTGKVIRGDVRRDNLIGEHVPWSPNLLPTAQPRPGAQPHGLLARLFQAPEPDPGFLEEQDCEAMADLPRRAHVWLLKHGENVEAWSECGPVA